MSLLQFEIGNYELFSNLPKEVQVYGSQRYPAREWSLLGSYTAKEQRSIQSFDIHTDAFFKYIKVSRNANGIFTVYI